MSGHSQPNRSPQNRTQNQRFRIWVAIGAAIILVIVGFFVVRTQGFVSGSEFSPTHFQQRDFSFYEIPLLHLQITPIKRTGTTPKTATYVRQNSLIPTASGAPEDWHLVWISRGMMDKTPADANLLIEQLKLTSGSDEYWRKWSVDHPALAKLLWPVIGKLAERELYILMPRLLEIVQPISTPEALQAAIDEYLPAQYARLIKDLNDAGRKPLAEGLLQEAAADYPDDKVLQSLR